MPYSIMLDAGHGGTDPGAVYNGRREKDDTLRLVFAIGQILQDRGVDVEYTRTTDIYETPFQKAMEANEAGVDYFVSIHRNSFEQDNIVSGVESLVYDLSGIKYRMAENINANLETVGFVNLGVKARPNLVVLKRTKMPAVLVEVGFLNSDTDNQLFDENFNDIALAIADGILETLEEVARESAVNQTETGQEMLSSENGESRQNGAYFENSENKQNETYSEDNALNKIVGVVENAKSSQDTRLDRNVESPRDATLNNNIETTRNVAPNRNTESSENITTNNRTESSGSATLNNNTESSENITTNNSAEPSGNTISGNVISDNRLPEKARPSRPGAYRVQVGLYRNWVYAQRLLDELLAAGYPAYLDESGPYIRVQVGPFMTLIEAVHMERKLRRDGYDTLVIRGK